MLSADWNMEGAGWEERDRDRSSVMKRRKENAVRWSVVLTQSGRGARRST